MYTFVKRESEKHYELLIKEKLAYIILRIEIKNMKIFENIYGLIDVVNWYIEK